jgi:hypothetical protein
MLWQEMRVVRLPSDTVARLRTMTPAALEAKLGVLAEWRLDGDRWVPVAPGANLGPRRGVRREGARLQMGLSRSELQSVERLRTRLLGRIDRGEITTFDADR